jgi:hypothetical protein
MGELYIRFTDSVYVGRYLTVSAKVPRKVEEATGRYRIRPGQIMRKAFGEAVKRRTLNGIRARQGFPRPRTVSYGSHYVVGGFLGETYRLLGEGGLLGATASP